MARNYLLWAYGAFPITETCLQWTIGGPKGVLQKAHGVALNPKNKELLVTDKHMNAVLTFYVPELF